MPNYDDLKKRAKDALDTIADVSVEAYKLAEEKARVLAKRAKLNAEITRERGMIRRAKSSIGNAYYDLHRDDPEDALKQYFQDIEASHNLIAANLRELEELKKGNASCCDEEDAEDAGSCCCTNDDDHGNDDEAPKE